MTAGGAWLAVEEALAAWPLEERRHVDAGHLVLSVEVDPSAGCSRLTVYSQKC